MSDSMKDRVLKILLDDSIPTNEERRFKLLPLQKEWATNFQGPPDEMMDGWNRMFSDLVAEHNLRERLMKP